MHDTAIDVTVCIVLLLIKKKKKRIWSFVTSLEHCPGYQRKKQTPKQDPIDN